MNFNNYFLDLILFLVWKLINLNFIFIKILFLL